MPEVYCLMREHLFSNTNWNEVLNAASGSVGWHLIGDTLTERFKCKYGCDTLIESCSYHELFVMKSDISLPVQFKKLLLTLVNRSSQNLVH